MLSIYLTSDIYRPSFSFRAVYDSYVMMSRYERDGSVKIYSITLDEFEARLIILLKDGYKVKVK